MVHCFPSYWLIRSVYACWADSASNTISNAPSSQLWVNKAIARSSAWLHNVRLFSILLSSSDMGSAGGLGTDKTPCIFNNLRYTLASRLQRGKLLPSVSWVLKVGMVIPFGDSSVIFFFLLIETLFVKRIRWCVIVAQAHNLLEMSCVKMCMFYMCVILFFLII
jgi:hypothetical protein